MDVKTFLRTVKYIAPTTTKNGLKRPPAVLIRGRHGIGKSAIVSQAAQYVFQLPMIDKRIGQMTEGDIIGLPWKEGGVTRFAPVDFIKRACDEPVVLFFDEMNRGTREVLQCMFQVVNDYEMNGHVLHEGTRIFVAINDGAEYQVTRMDPALKDRFWVVDLEPTVEDWCAWAQSELGGIHPYIVDFVKLNPQFLEVAKETDNSKVYPSRRSWERCSNCTKSIIDDISDPSLASDFFAVASGFVGSSVAASLRDFVNSQGQAIKALDILDNFDKTLPRIKKMSQEKWNYCVDKVVAHLKGNKLSEAQAENLGKFIGFLPAELRLTLWMRSSTEGGVDHPITIHNARTMHKYARTFFLEAITGEASVAAGAIP